MNETPVRMGIIGLGVIAQRMLPLFTEHGQIRITAVCDVNGDLAAKIATDLGGIPAFTDYRRLLAEGAVDVVYVATPPAYHHAIALDVIRAGKHLFCEKPLALNVAQAAEMVAAAEVAGVVTALNIGMPYRPGVRRFGELAAAGFLGELRRLDLTLIFPQWPRAWQMTPWVGSRAQGGPIREVGPHFIHVIQRFFGPIARLRAEMEYPADPAACEHGAAGVLQLASGQIVTVNVVCHVPRPESVILTAYGTKGTLAITGFRDLLVAAGNGPLVPDESLANAAQGLQPNQELVANLVRGVCGEPADLIPLRGGLAIQRVLDAWELAAANGAWVDIPAI